jgi:hypothetical protein
LNEKLKGLAWMFHSLGSRRRQSALISRKNKLAPTDVGGYTLRAFSPHRKISGLGRSPMATWLTATLFKLLPDDQAGKLQDGEQLLHCLDKA